MLLMHGFGKSRLLNFIFDYHIMIGPGWKVIESVQLGVDCEMVTKYSPIFFGKFS